MNMHESSTLSEAMASSARAPTRTSALGLALMSSEGLGLTLLAPGFGPMGRGLPYV